MRLSFGLILRVSLVLYMGLAAALPALADEPYAEVIGVSGKVRRVRPDGTSAALARGDRLRAGDLVETDQGEADLAYDRDWRNVTRFDKGSSIAIRSLRPTSLMITKGTSYAILKGLRRGESFEMRTPTAVAYVRGSEYLMSYSERLGSKVMNLSRSLVTVRALDPRGEPMGDPEILNVGDLTLVSVAGEFPGRRQRMARDDTRKAERLRKAVKRSIEASPRKRLELAKRAERAVGAANSAEDARRLAEQALNEEGQP